MKLKERAKIIKEINFPNDFLTKGDFSYRIIDYKGFKYIVGFCLDSTFDENSFFVQYFTQPLFIPFSTLAFTLGDRIGSYWNNSMLEEVSSKILNMNVPKNINDLLYYWETKFKKFNDNYKFQAIGFSYFLLDDFDKSIKELEKVSFANIENQPTWKQEEMFRIKRILTLLKEKEYEEISKLFMEWQDFTIKSLKLKV